MTEQPDREAMRLALARKRVVYELPGMDGLPTRRDLVFRAASGAELLMDVYYPAPSAQRPPLVVLPMAYADPAGRIRAFGPVTSWAQLLAASGMAAVVCGPESPVEDGDALLQHLRANAHSLGVDGERIGLLASSANATVGLSMLIRDKQLTCAAFLCGYTMDLDGSPLVAEAAAQFGFSNACAGRTPDDLPATTPLLFVRAGLDQFPGLNTALDELIRRAVARNLPIWFINHATASHGFELDDPSSITRGVIQQVLAFLQLHLVS